MNWFFACWYELTQIKWWFKILQVGIVKNGCGQSGDWDLKLTVSEEWKNGINWFFACWYRFTKIKTWSKVFLDGHGQKWVWSVWAWDSKIECISKMNWWNKLIFFVCWYKCRKAKNWVSDFWVGVVKNICDLLVHETLKSAVS